MSLDPVKIYLSLRFPKSAKIHEVDGLRTEKRQVLIHIMTLNIMNDTLMNKKRSLTESATPT